MENPNEYVDEDFSRYSVAADSAIQCLWEAGAKADEIEEIVRNAFENAGVKVNVTIEEA